MSRKYISKKKKHLVFIRAKYRCEYCQSRADVALETFEIEHILPVTKSGSDDLINLALACRGCNTIHYPQNSFPRAEATLLWKKGLKTDISTDSFGAMLLG